MRLANSPFRLRRQTRGEFVFDVCTCLLLTLVVLIVLYPLIYVVSASFSSARHVISGDVRLLPVEFTLKSYQAVFKNDDILNGFCITVLITLGGTALNLVLTTLAAYPLSRRDLRGRNVFMFFITITMFFSGGIVPTYLIIQKLGLINNLLVLVLPTAISTYNMIIMRTFFQSSIPYELQEAAFIDGCSNTRTLIQIILPLSGPILAVIALYYAVAHWNAYFNAMMYLTKRPLYPLQLILKEILIQSQMTSMMEMDDSLFEQAMMGETIKYSVIVVSSLPMLIIYPFIQKFFVKGVMIGAIKG